MRDGLEAMAVLNMAAITGSDNREAAEALVDYPTSNYLNTLIRRRKGIANAAGNGISVLEYMSRDEKAATEFNELLKAVS